MFTIFSSCAMFELLFSTYKHFFIPNIKIAGNKYFILYFRIRFRKFVPFVCSRSRSRPEQRNKINEPDINKIVTNDAFEKASISPVRLSPLHI